MAKSRKKSTLTRRQSQAALKKIVARFGAAKVAEKQAVTARTVQRWLKKGLPKTRWQAIVSVLRRSEAARKAVKKRKLKKLALKVAELSVDLSQLNSMVGKGVVPQIYADRIARKFEIESAKYQALYPGGLITDLRSLTREQLRYKAGILLEEYGLQSLRQVYTLFYYI